MPSALLGSDNYQFFTSLAWLNQGSNPWVRIPQSIKTGDRRSTHSTIPSGLVWWWWWWLCLCVCCDVFVCVYVSLCVRGVLLSVVCQIRSLHRFANEALQMNWKQIFHDSHPFCAIIFCSISCWIFRSFLAALFKALFTSAWTSGAVAESIERGPHMQEMGSLVNGWFKPMTYQIEICHFLARCSTIIRIGQGQVSSVPG